jgi:hypothetical protein
MKVVFISGRYSSKRLIGKIRNILRARRWAKYYWRLGYVVICPHMNSALMEMRGGAPDEVFLRGDREILRKCDEIIMIPGWENSLGAVAERALAKELGIHIMYAKGAWEL